MKKILASFLLAMLAVLTLATTTSTVEATTVSTCTTNQTVFVHYHKWDGDYTDSTIWSWGYGTNGSGSGSGVVETDGFGAVYQLCVDDDSDASIGLIMKYGEAWGSGLDDRDGLDLDGDGAKDNKAIVVKEDDAFVGFTDGVKHVYVLEGSNQVIYADDANSLPYSETLATVAVIYYDSTQMYDGWNVWTWGNGTLGSKVGDGNPSQPGSGIPIVSQLGVDGGDVENLKVAFIQVDPTDMDAEIGFIMRTDDWAKKYEENIMIPTTGLVAGSFVDYFYIAGEGSLYETFTAFDQVVNLFEISSARALDPNSVEVEFNTEIEVMLDGVEVLDQSKFSVVDKDGNAVAIDSINYIEGEFAAEFTLLLDGDLVGSGSPYTVSYVKSEDLTVTKEFKVDNLAPVITIVGATEISINTGDTYSLPNYRALDQVDPELLAAVTTAEDALQALIDGGTATQAELDEAEAAVEAAEKAAEPNSIYNVKVKSGHGTVDTRNGGVYEVVIIAEDAFGNTSEKTITVTVVDICAEETDVFANIAFASSIPLFVAALVLGGLSFTKTGRKATKKFVFVFLLGASLVVLAGCKPAEEEQCDNNAENGILYEFDKNQTEIVEIKLWHDDEDYAMAIIEAFEANYPDIKVRWENVNLLETHQRMELYSGSEYLPDVAWVAHNVIGSALNSNLLYPFPDDLRADLVSRNVSTAIATATSCWDPANNKAVECAEGFESELFGAPMTGESVALFYNKTILQELNGSTDPETTLEAILAHAPTFNQMDDPATQDVDETKLIFTHPVNNAYYMHGIATAFGFELFGESGSDPTQVNLNSPEMVAALTFIQDTLAPASGLGATTQTDNYQTIFENGNAAYMVNGPWAIQSVTEAATNNSFEWGITKLPTINGNDMISFSGIQLGIVSKETKNPTAAFKLIEFMSSDEGLAIMYDQMNRAPALKDATGIPGISDDVFLSGVALQMAYSEPMPIIREMGFYWANAMAMYVTAWDGTDTPQNAADTAQQGFEGQAEIGNQ